MSLTLENLRLEVREFLGEPDNESDPMWSNSFINKWINRFVRVVAEVSECIETYATFNTVSGTAVYALPEVAVTAPEPDITIFKPHLVKYGDFTELKPIDVKDLASINITLSGTPMYYMIFNDQIYLYPVPNAVEAVHVWGYGRPDSMVADSDGCGLIDELADVVIKLVLAKARQQEEEFGVANQYYSEVPYNISDFLIKSIQKQTQEAPIVVDFMKFGG